jgi:hypothetical protein
MSGCSVVQFFDGDPEGPDGGVDRAARRERGFGIYRHTVVRGNGRCTCDVTWLGGCRTFVLDLPDSAEAGAADLAALVAVQLRVDVQTLCDWFAHSGHVPCQAKTRSGRWCSCRVAGTSQLDPARWAAAYARGGYCKAHGGGGG